MANHHMECIFVGWLMGHLDIDVDFLILRKNNADCYFLVISFND